MPEGRGMGLTGHAGECFGGCRYRSTWSLLPEYSSLAEVRILSQDKSIGHDGADQRSYEKRYQVLS